MIDYSACTIADLRALESICTRLCDVIVGSLRVRYPGCIEVLFPPRCILPDWDTARTYDDATFDDVLVCADAGACAILARAELDARRLPN
jgi:hypothetical protein